MSNLKSLIKEVLYEQKEKQLKVFYNVDIFLQDFKEQGQEEQPAPVQQEQPPEGEQPPAEQPPAPEGEAPPTESTNKKEIMLAEDIFKTKGQGSIVVPKEKAITILTLNDLLEFLDDQNTDNGTSVINDLVIEAIKSLSGQNTQQALEDILNKGDKLNIILDYGFDKDDSIGLQVNKNPGVDLATMIMRKDGEPMTGKFNLQVFNQTITSVFLKEIK